MTKKEFKQRLKEGASKFAPIHNHILDLDIHGHVKAILEEYSGGGCWHLMFHLNDDRVLNVICDDLIWDGTELELSYNPWVNLESFFAAEESIVGGGFGWEYRMPDYDKRRVQCVVTDDNRTKEMVRILLEYKAS